VNYFFPSTDWGFSYWIFFHGPVLILTTFSSSMFILTAIHIWKVKREVKRFAQPNMRKRPCLDIDVQTYEMIFLELMRISFTNLSYLQFLRLFVIMGVSWLLDRITSLFRYLLGTIILDISVYLNTGFGIIIFVLLILKTSTLQLLINR